MRRTLWAAMAAAFIMGWPASATTIDRQCAIGDVSVFADRVHLLCTPPPQPDSAFAYSGAWGRQVYAAPYSALRILRPKRAECWLTRLLPLDLPRSRPDELSR